LIDEVLVEHQRLGGRPRFACDDEERMRQIDFRLKSQNGRRVGAVEHMQFRVAGNLSESSAEDFRAETAAAHSEQHYVFKSLIANARAEGRKLVRRVIQLIGHGHPAERVFDDLLVILFLFPQAGVFAVDFARPLFALRALDRFLDGRFVRAEVRLHPVEQPAGHRGPFRRDALHQAFKRIGERFDAFVL